MKTRTLFHYTNRSRSNSIRGRGPSTRQTKIRLIVPRGCTVHDDCNKNRLGQHVYATCIPPRWMYCRYSGLFWQSLIGLGVNFYKGQNWLLPSVEFVRLDHHFVITCETAWHGFRGWRPVLEFGKGILGQFSTSEWPIVASKAGANPRSQRRVQ